MNKTITIDQLGKAIQEIVDDYSEDATNVVEKTLPEIGKKAVKEVKSKSPKRTGSYKKGWKMKVEKGRLSTQIVVYNKTRYQLTHLLEKGHANRGGGRTEGIPHIEPTEKNAVANALKQIKRGLENI